MDEARLKRMVHVETQDVYDADAISKTIENMIASDGFDLKGRSAFILFDCDVKWNLEGGGANPAMVIAAAEALIRLGAAIVMVGDPSPPGRKLFCSGFSAKDISRLRGSARIVSLARCRRVRVKVGDAMAQNEFLLPKLMFDSDFLLVVPKLRTDITTAVSTSMIVMLQALKDHERLMFHDFRLHQKLVDLFFACPADYVIYDAVEAQEGQSPVCPAPRSMGLIAGGANQVNVDIAASWLAGFAPQEIDHLRILADRDMGNTNIRTLNIQPTGIMDKRTVLKKADWNAEGLSEKVIIHGGADKYCGGGCAGFFRQALEPWEDYIHDKVEAPISVLIGRPLEKFDKPLDRYRTIVVGDCCARHNRLGIFVPGCAPDPIKIELALLKIIEVPGARGMKVSLAARLGVPDRLILASLRSRSLPGAKNVRISLFSLLKSMILKAIRIITGFSGSG